ncbi:MAG: hypothetical protein KGO94_00515 [Alphaproteobacteria bacterium]|nr:hypothetical protein [Alphaproteobacteria bacterium]
MKKIILALAVLSAFSGAAFAGNGYSHNSNALFEKNSHIKNSVPALRRLKIVPTANVIDSNYEASPAMEKTLDQREIRRLDEKNHGR